jgi:hypothetical protein
MNNHGCQVAVHDADLQHPRRLIRSDEHGETFVDLIDPDRVGVGVGVS